MYPQYRQATKVKKVFLKHQRILLREVKKLPLKCQQAASNFMVCLDFCFPLLNSFAEMDFNCISKKKTKWKNKIKSFELKCKTKPQAKKIEMLLVVSFNFSGATSNHKQIIQLTCAIFMFCEVYSAR